ncbi:MAG: hypothetical protein ACR2GO_07350 [Candidatus Limnocylindria bacterium]
MLLNLALWIGGAALLALAIWRVRVPFARMGELDRLAENARRYDSWRGGRSGPDAAGTTGADVMSALLRRQVLSWGAVGGVGILLLVAGFVIR